jgi:hypothetical protein
MQTNSGPEDVGEESTTIECVEHLMEKCYPGLQFVPIGAVSKMKNLIELFGVPDSLIGTHPNCECFTLMMGDGSTKGFKPISDYLKVGFKTLIRNLIKLDKEMDQRLRRSILSRLFGTRGRKLSIGLSLLLWSRSYVKWAALLGPKPFNKIRRILYKCIFERKKLSRSIRTVYEERTLLKVIILPYEEPGCLESDRLSQCPVSFACEHPQTGNVTLVPFCSYFVTKNDILRKTTERWGTARSQSASAEELATV